MIILLLIGMFLTFLGLVALVINLIKKNKPARSNSLKLMALGAALLLVSLIVLPDTVESEDKQAVDVLRESAENVWQDKLVKYDIDANKDIIITAQMSDNFTENAVKRTFLKDIYRYFEYTQNENFNTITVNGYFDLYDKYNNATNTKLLEIRFNKSTIDKINFDNGSYDYENLLDIADYVYIHPIIR